MILFACSYKVVLTLILAGYLLGSIPFGLIFFKIAGRGDIRKHGSGNIGATNVVRNGGKFLGFLTLVCDGGKAAVAIIIARNLCHDYLIEISVGVVAILGHIFPVWLKFKGGKGVATGLVVFLMTNVIVGIAACVSWLLTFLFTKTSGAAAVLSFALAPGITYLYTNDPRLTTANSLIAILVIIRHRDNIKTIIKTRLR